MQDEKWIIMVEVKPKSQKHLTKGIKVLKPASSDGRLRNATMDKHLFQKCHRSAIIF
jgi:hypothetical protein